jgi:hypothetical protein
VPAVEEPLAGERSLKAQQRATPNDESPEGFPPNGAGNVEADIFQASPDIGRPKSSNEPDACRSKSSDIP